MKRIAGITLVVSAFTITSCGGYSEEQAAAADDFCSCMENGSAATGDEDMDFAINFAECDIKINEDHGGEVMADDGWALALEEKCPDIAGKIADSE